MPYQSWSVSYAEQPSASKWGILGANDAYFDSIKNRFVVLSPAVSVVNADPANTSWTSVDITANTSATATAASVRIAITSNDASVRNGYLRKTGSGSAQDTTTQVVTSSTANAAHWSHAVVALDASQTFDWSVSDGSSVTQFVVIVDGYWEVPA